MHYTILGGGSVTAQYYLPAFRWMRMLDRVTVVDPSRKSMGFLRRTFGGIDLRPESYDAYLNRVPANSGHDQDCIIIALPNAQHVAAVRMSLERRQHVLCEKPLALKARECAELATLAARRNQLLKVAMSRRYLPSLMLAREMVARREMGEVRSIEVHDCTPFLWRPQSFAFFAPEAGGVLADMGVHYLDYLETLVGPLSPLAYADDARGGVESSACYSLVAGDVPIKLRLSRLQQSGAFMRIACERGEIYVDKSNEQEVLATPVGLSSRRISIDRPFGKENHWPSNFQGSFCQMLADFERAVRGENTRIADVTDAERTVALIEWAYDRRQLGAPAPAKTCCSSRCKVLITGATGFIGGHLVERLSAEGTAIRIAARRPETCVNVSRFSLQTVPTNLLDRESVRQAVAGAKTVYHLAYGRDGLDTVRATVEGTKNVVELAIEAGTECVVILSTMYVFGFPDTDRPVDESFPYRPYGGEYAHSKMAMERWCLARARTALPTRIVILTPTCVFGPDGGAYTSLPVELARKQQFCWIDGGTGICNYTYVENLIDAMLAAVRVAEAHGNRFIINDGHTSWREFLGPLIGTLNSEFPSFSMAELQALNRNANAFSLRALLAAAVCAPQIRAIARRSQVIRLLAQLTRIETSIAGVQRATDLGDGHDRSKAVTPPEWLASLYGPAKTVFSAKKAEQVLNWHPRVDFASALSKTLSWLEATGQLPTAGAGDRPGGE